MCALYSSAWASSGRVEGIARRPGQQVGRLISGSAIANPSDALALAPRSPPLGAVRGIPLTGAVSQFVSHLLPLPEGHRPGANRKAELHVLHPPLPVLPHHVLGRRVGHDARAGPRPRKLLLPSPPPGTSRREGTCKQSDLGRALVRAKRGTERHVPGGRHEPAGAARAGCGSQVSRRRLEEARAGTARLDERPRSLGWLPW